MNRAGHLLLLAGTVLLFQSCTWKSHSRGSAGIVVIVAEPADRAVINTSLKTTFGKTIQTPQDESLFQFTDISFNKLDYYARAPLILMVASLDADEPTARYIHQLFDEEALSAVRNGVTGCFLERDPWAEHQMLMVLVGSDREQLANNASSCLGALADSAAAFEIERLASKMLWQSAQILSYLTPKTGVSYSLSLPSIFEWVAASDTLSLVRYRSRDPLSWVTVYSLDETGADSMTAPSLLELRRKMTTITDKSTVSYAGPDALEHTTLAGRRAERIRGLWQSDDYADGGPFATYSFLDSTTHHRFVLDYALFAPGREKAPFIWQLDASIQTFSLKSAKD